MSWIFQWRSHTLQYLYLLPRLSKSEYHLSWLTKQCSMRLKGMSTNRILQDAKHLVLLARLFWIHHCTYPLLSPFEHLWDQFSSPTLASQSIPRCYRSTQPSKGDALSSWHYLSFMLRCCSVYPLRKGRGRMRTSNHAKSVFQLRPWLSRTNLFRTVLLPRDESCWIFQKEHPRQCYHMWIC